jgi:FtsH-binding integral membrane protein
VHPSRRLPALAAATLILGLGLLALIVPAWFAAIVAALQTPPLLYLAALLRFTIGVLLLRAADGSRARLAVFFLGFVMVLGGLVTPIIGQGLARPILDAWLQGGEAVVRGWGVAATLLGAFLLWALKPKAHGQ